MGDSAPPYNRPVFSATATGGESASASPFIPEIDVESTLTYSLSDVARLRESEERFRTTFELAAVGIAHVGLEGEWLRVNQKLCDIIGYSREELLGRTFQDITHPDDLNGDLERFELLKAGKLATYSIEKRYFRKDGSIIWIHLTVALTRNAQGDPDYCISVIEDIQARHAAQEAAREYALRVEALNAKLERSVRETHHRVKNNLQVISALIEMESADDQEFVPASVLRRIGNHVRSLASIHDLLTKEAQGVAETGQVSAAATLEKLLPVVQRILAGRTLDWQVQDAPIPLRQASSLAILVNELVSNAAKHGRGRIQLTFQVSEGQVWLEVSDEGPGFPADFDPNSSSNTGLELIESVGRWDLQGDIRYGNHPEGGAHVTVVFPLKKTL